MVPRENGARHSLFTHQALIHSLFIPAIMIDGEIIVAGKDIGEEELETIIRRHLDKS